MLANFRSFCLGKWGKSLLSARMPAANLKQVCVCVCFYEHFHSDQSTFPKLLLPSTHFTIWEPLCSPLVAKLVKWLCLWVKQSFLPLVRSTVIDCASCKRHRWDKAFALPLTAVGSLPNSLNKQPAVILMGSYVIPKLTKSASTLNVTPHLSTFHQKHCPPESSQLILRNRHQRTVAKMFELVAFLVSSVQQCLSAFLPLTLWGNILQELSVARIHDSDKELRKGPGHCFSFFF